MEDRTILSLIERMKQRSKESTVYGGESDVCKAAVSVRVCPSCGAGRAKLDGLTRCSYCGFEFVAIELTDGIHIRKEDNSN